VRFRAISGDHAGAAVPHLHADIGDGQVVIELLADGNVRLSHARAEPTKGNVTASNIRMVLTTACENYDVLLALWKKSQGD